MSTLEVNKITPQGVATEVTLGDSGDTFTIPSGVTLTNNGTVTGIGGANTPYFEVKMSTATNVSAGTWTKVALDSEDLDSNNAFDSSTNYRFTVPVGEGGRYFLYSSLVCKNASSALYQSQSAIYKNGSSLIQQANEDSESNTAFIQTNIHIITTLAEGDYIELYGNPYSFSGQNSFFTNSGGTNRYCHLGGYKIIE
jgi:hypothetical protein